RNYVMHGITLKRTKNLRLSTSVLELVDRHRCPFNMESILEVFKFCLV
ncbi:6635_t:CDS:1, partial [Funneliformis mosseae]